MNQNDAMEMARAFKGTKNSDWTPIFQTFEVHGIEFEMCLVPPGSFMMGSDDIEDIEKSAHPIIVTEPYWIGVHPVTNAQWRSAVETSKGQVKAPSVGADWYKDNSKTNHPVVTVTWYQCMEFLKWLGANWYLPTEPHWEYAARGLDNLVYPFGNDFQPDLVIYAENSKNSTAAIGGRPKGASWVGVQDMSGNVCEWMMNQIQGYPYKADDRRVSMSPDSPKALRGGSWNDHRSLMRSMSRGHSRPFYGLNIIGFRCIYVPSL